jgi:hypothetical protein
MGEGAFFIKSSKLMPLDGRKPLLLPPNSSKSVCILSPLVCVEEVLFRGLSTTDDERPALLILSAFPVDTSGSFALRWPRVEKDPSYQVLALSPYAYGSGEFSGKKGGNAGSFGPL